MRTLKLIGLLLVSVIATGSVIYQLRYNRPQQSAVVAGTKGAPTVPPAQSTAAPALVSPAPAASSIPTPVSVPSVNAPRVNIPRTGWGRNPFLTIDEINRMNQPELPVVIETPVPTPVVEPPPPVLPAYAVTGILRGVGGNAAIIDGRGPMRAGSRIGSETVKEVRERSVILEHDGHLRELRLRTIEDSAAAAPPKKEVTK